MYTVVLGLHNITRWIVLIIGIAAIVRAALGWLGKKRMDCSRQQTRFVFHNEHGHSDSAGFAAVCGF